MHSTQDSATLPFWPSRAGLAAGILGLLLIGVFAASSPLDAQVALENRSESARLWSSSGEPENLAIGRDRIARTAVAAEGARVVAGEDLTSGDLFYMMQTSAGPVELPTPPSQAAPLRSDPVLLAAGDRLEGTIWLEGASALESDVLASVWNGTSFERVETVSVHKAGPQLALSATVLDDGSWLVLWAGFDGTDDDIFWSRRENGAWSKPKRLHADNEVPDILPTVTASAAGARAAWSFFDGNDYRVRTARWNGRGWELEGALAGRGVGPASFETVAGRSFLTFQTVVPEAWNLVEFEDGGERRFAKFRESYSESPLIVIDESERATLSWPWRRETEQP